MTLKVAVCDDEKQICRDLEAALKKILDMLNIGYEIDTYSSGERLCKKMEQQAHYDLFFLDIEFAKGEINGVEVGKRIRDYFEQQAASIVYISWEKKYSYDLHKIRPIDFLIKPLEYEKIEEAVTTHLKIFRLLADDFVYKVQHDTFRVKVNNIVYLESDKRKLVLHLSDGKKEVFYGTLKEVYMEQLQKFDFLLIHKSYAVNYSFISALKRESLVLTTGATLPVSRSKKDEVEEAYFSIMKRQGLV